MKPFHIDLLEDLAGFIKLCRSLADSSIAHPVFNADNDRLGDIHFFLATPLWRAHLTLSASGRHKEAISRIENEGGLHVVRGSVRYWAVETPTFPALLDTSGF
ncbi:MAG: hypothetical protein ABL856_11375 [Gallionella sp.]